MANPSSPTIGVLKAMGHPVRLRILAMLRDGELCVCQMTALLDLATSTVSAHLADLKRAGLVSERKDGRWVFYRLTDEEPPVLASVWEAVSKDARVQADAKLLRQIREGGHRGAVPRGPGPEPPGNPATRAAPGAGPPARRAHEAVGADERLRALPQPVGGRVHGAGGGPRQGSLPGFVGALREMEFGTGSHINIPIAILIWLMIYPMMLRIDFASLRGVGKRPGGLVVTLFVNWLVKPFSMAFLGWLFFRHVFTPWIGPELASEYIAGRHHPRRGARAPRWSSSGPTSPTATRPTPSSRWR